MSLVFKPIDNKIPCGGFSVYGNAVKNRHVESEQFNSLLAKTIGGILDDVGDSHLRCLHMNLEDYFAILYDLRDEDGYPTKKKMYYNVRFIPFDFTDYIKFQTDMIKMNEWCKNHRDMMESMSEIDVYKKFIPYLFTGGSAMDFYDVADLYANNLGLKSVTVYSPNFNAFVAKYYGTTTDNLDSFIRESTVITIAGEEIGNASRLHINDVFGKISFIDSDMEEYGKYKNIISFGGK